MAQLVSRTGSAIGFDVGNMLAVISAMRDSVRYGQPIRAADMQALVAFYNQLIYHYHPVTDLVGIDDYGNVGKYGPAGAYVNHNTNGPNPQLSPISTPATFGAGNQIRAADINIVIAAINSLRIAHTHVTNDITA